MAMVVSRKGQVTIPKPIRDRLGLSPGAAVDFERDKTSKQPNVAFEIRVLDERGEPIHSKPTTNAINKDVPEQAVAIPMGFALTLNRPGKFTVELLANYYRGSDLVVLAKGRIAGLRLQASDGPFATGSGPLVSGSTLALIMAMTGRETYCDELDGDGVATLRARCTTP